MVIMIEMEIQLALLPPANGCGDNRHSINTSNNNHNMN